MKLTRPLCWSHMWTLMVPAAVRFYVGSDPLHKTLWGVCAPSASPAPRPQTFHHQEYVYRMVWWSTRLTGKKWLPVIPFFFFKASNVFFFLSPKASQFLKVQLVHPLISYRSQATQSSLPPSLHSSRAHSPDSSTFQHTKTEPPSHREAQHDSNQRHISGSDRVAPPPTSVDKSTSGQDLRATKTKSTERVRSGAKPTGGERHVKSQSSKQGRKRKSQESAQTK